MGGGPPGVVNLMSDLSMIEPVNAYGRLLEMQHL
jgi:hypothetical protein